MMQRMVCGVKANRCFAHKFIDNKSHKWQKVVLGKYEFEVESFEDV